MLLYTISLAMSVIRHILSAPNIIANCISGFFSFSLSLMSMNALRQRKSYTVNSNPENDIECISLLPANNSVAEKDHEEISRIVNRNEELETLVVSLKQMLHKCRYREKKIMVALNSYGGDIALSDLEDGFLAEVDQINNEASPNFFDNSTFFENMINRSGWLIGLLVFQSCSSFILSSNEALIQRHPNIIYFLTMLVGAGGNAGNQATVRVIREIAVGSLNNKTRWPYIFREFGMAISLAFIVGLFGLLRVSFFSSISHPEAIAISLALMTIVFLSIVVGALLPLFFQLIHLDPANSSTTIQVIMDISGVLITCLVATSLLDTSFGNAFMRAINMN